MIISYAYLTYKFTDQQIVQIVLGEKKVISSVLNLEFGQTKNGNPDLNIKYCNCRHSDKLSYKCLWWGQFYHLPSFTTKGP